MNDKKNITKFISKEDALKERKCYLFDATGKTLGRFASEIAKILRGKHKPSYTPNTDTGDAVIVINAEKIKVTGSKAARKVYTKHTGWLGGLRVTPYRVMLRKNPEHILKHAVRGMLPVKKPLARAQLKKLHIFIGEKHNMQAQKPIAVNI